MEYLDEASATVAKEALHNYKLDGENKIKVRPKRRSRMSLSVLMVSYRSPSPGSKTVSANSLEKYAFSLLNCREFELSKARPCRTWSMILYFVCNIAVFSLKANLLPVSARRI